MRNLPPPDPRSSRISLDELVGIIVAFTAIGTILAVTLAQKDKRFNLNRFLNPSAPNKTATLTGEATPIAPPPSALPEATLSPQPIESPPPISASPTPTRSLPASPALPPEAPQKVSRTLPPPVPLAPKPEASAETSPATPSNTAFPDVPKDLWARPYIDALAKQGIMKGLPDGTFKPGNPIARSEFAALLQKAFDQKPKLKTQKFKDVSAESWALSAIQETSKSGFLQGYPKTIFRPNQNIPRVQVFVALANGLGLTPTADSNKLSQIYRDARQIPKYAIEEVGAATKAGLVVNYPNTKMLNPNRNATRAEVAVSVYQALVRAGKAKAIPSKYVVKP